MTEPYMIKHPETEVDYDAMQTRSRAMVEAGTHPMIADRLARDAAQNQSLRDRQLKLTASVVQTPVTVTTTAVVPEAVPVGADPVAPDLHV